MKNNPKISLVGAGPGDPELISRKAFKRLLEADVILYDALVAPALLDEIPAHITKINVGKRAGLHVMKQSEINELLVESALAYGHVVRLKGGDPFVFGRAQEEIEAAEAFGIPVEVIPGISSINLAGMHQIPLTVRNCNQSFFTVTATDKDGNLSNDIYLAAKSSSTAVIFMGLNKAEQIAEIYKEANKGQLPVAVISNGSMANEKVIVSRIDLMVEAIKESEISAPALLLIGDSIAYSAQYKQQFSALTLPLVLKNNE